MARFIPESPAFLFAQGRTDELARLADKFGIVQTQQSATPETDPGLSVKPGFGAALVVTALSWSFVNFGLLLWLPMDLQARGYSAALASGILASSGRLTPSQIIG